MDTTYEIGRLDGRLDSVGDEIGGLRDQIGDIHSTVGGLDAKLDRLIVTFGSGPHRIITEPQEAIEPKTDTILGKVDRLLKTPNVLHLVYLGAILILALWLISAKTGRPISDFTNVHADGRSTIGPLERLGESIGPSGKSVTREGISYGSP